MTRIALILIATTLLLGCFAADPDPVSKLPAYHGQSRTQVVAKLGEPQRDEKFRMSNASGEFRIELQNTYPLNNPANANVEIEEMTWRDGDFWITLWLHQANGQWVVLDSCRWDKNVAF
jgi:hypothetical protein